MRKVIIGNNCVSVENCNWYAWLRDRLYTEKLADEVVLKQMPDPILAREKIWIPFIRQTLGAERHTILVGHSSGAAAAMRLCEENEIGGLVLICASHTDLGDENERLSGYFNRDWQWDSIRNNAGQIVQMHSADDPLIPITEGRHVAESLKLIRGEEYFEYESRSHFFTAGDDILDAVKIVAFKLWGN